MCRLAGWYNPELPEGTDRARLLKHLMRKSQAGGEASFGMAMVTDGKPKIIRHIGPASTWLETHKKDIAECAKSDVIIGHTRQPTKGAVTKANTHPFTIGEWAAAHNGMISNSSSLMEAALYTPRGETDSEEALCYVISADWDPEAIDKITGSYAFTGAKADGSEVVLVCDNGQNLHYVRFGDGLVWATSATVLRSSLAAVGIKAEPIKIEKQVIRIPEWTTAPVDAKYGTTTYYNRGSEHSNYHGYHRVTDKGPTTFPAVEPDKEDENTKCSGCDHILKEHTEQSGCIKAVDGRVCSCAQFTTVPVCPNVNCKHEVKGHSTGWGCMETGCKCEVGKISSRGKSVIDACPNVNCKHEPGEHDMTTGCKSANCTCKVWLTAWNLLQKGVTASQLTLPTTAAGSTASKDLRDQDADELTAQDMITEEELEMLRQRHGVIDID